MTGLPIITLYWNINIDSQNFRDHFVHKVFFTSFIQLTYWARSVKVAKPDPSSLVLRIPRIKYKPASRKNKPLPMLATRAPSPVITSIIIILFSHQVHWAWYVVGLRNYKLVQFFEKLNIPVSVPAQNLSVVILFLKSSEPILTHLRRLMYGISPVSTVSLKLTFSVRPQP